MLYLNLIYIIHCIYLTDIPEDTLKNDDSDDEDNKNKDERISSKCLFSQKLYTFTHTHGSLNIDRHGEHIGDRIMNVLINILTVLTYFQLYITHKQFKTFLFS